jgi:4-alpha-glucanotransferase
MVLDRRSSGTLLHINTLPSRFGIGDLGPSAHRLVDLLVEAGHTHWQVLPLNPTTIECGNSPYTSESGYAGNPNFISPEGLAEDGLIGGDLTPYILPETSQIDYTAIERTKKALILRAYRGFLQKKRDFAEEFSSFEGKHSKWLEDYALYKTLWEHHDLPWYQWPDRHRARDPKSMESFMESERFRYHKFVQFIFFRQWDRLKKHCSAKGIRIIGDLPYYLSLDSADVWANPGCFKLGPDSRPAFVSGVPPDYFSPEGQLWGHPVYNWSRIQQDGFSFWMDRVRHSLDLFDLLRIDHFRGLLSYWEVPAREVTAARGSWIPVPSELFFGALSSSFPAIPFIAEDLGVITEDVRQAINRLGLPCMRVLLFAFDGDPNNIHLPQNHPENSIAYTGTHDTNTARGWFLEEASEQVRQNLYDCIGSWVAEADVSWALMGLASRSRARLSVFPIQDILSLGSESRMNRPAMAKDNYLWKLTDAQLKSMPTLRLRQMATESNRL